MSDPAPSGTRIFLVDDHPAVRQGLSLLFGQAGHVVCGEAESIAETLERIELARPDVVLVDISLDNESGFDLLPILRERGIKSLVYSMHGDCATIEQTFSAGAGGYVTKRDNTDSLLEAVDDVMAGRRHVSYRAAQCLAQKVLAKGRGNRESLLSERESLILGLLQKVLTTSEIADQLNISPRTVESYYTRIIDKLKLDGMKSLRRYVLAAERENK